MFKRSTSTLSPHAVFWLCRCKYLCRALVFVPAVLSGPWQACQAPFVMLSFSLSKGTVPLKTGASRPLRASRKGIGIGVMSLSSIIAILTGFLVPGSLAPEIHQAEASLWCYRASTWVHLSISDSTLIQGGLSLTDNAQRVALWLSIRIGSRVSGSGSLWVL